jgi:tetratricopeptide (TPR) repeat protein
MPGRRGLSGLAAVLLAPVLLLVGGALVTDGGPDDAAPAQVATQAGAPRGSVEALQDRLRRLPRDDAAWAALGVAYLGEARRTADPSFYDLAGDALDRSLAVRPEGNADALAGQAALANARHDFAAGRDLALRAVAVDAYDATARGVLFDAQLELGEYEAGTATLDAMLSLRPGVPSFTRASYLFELRGDTAEATSALERALDVATTPADASFALLHLGELALGAGDVETAAAHFAEGLRRDPARVDLLVGRARAAVARGDVDAALADYADVVERLPQPSYLYEYGELLESLGRDADADEQYAVAEAAQALFTAAGAVPDVETVLADADHGRADRALTTAQAQYATRRSVQVEDALAWALHAAGRSAEALPHALAAQRLGTRNALWDYHRGVIQLAAGQVEAGRASLALALETNPHFSVRHAPLAEQALAASAAG